LVTQACQQLKTHRISGRDLPPRQQPPAGRHIHPAVPSDINRPPATISFGTAVLPVKESEVDGMCTAYTRFSGRLVVDADDSVHIQCRCNHGDLDPAPPRLLAKALPAILGAYASVRELHLHYLIVDAACVRAIPAAAPRLTTLGLVGSRLDAGVMGLLGTMPPMLELVRFSADALEEPMASAAAVALLLSCRQMAQTHFTVDLIGEETALLVCRDVFRDEYLSVSW
jgi:hypothetical protein